VSKSAVVTSVVSIALHAGAVVLVRSEPLLRPAIASLSATAPLDIEVSLAPEMVPEAKPEAPVPAEPRAAAHPAPAVVRASTFVPSAHAAVAANEAVVAAPDVATVPVHFVLPTAIGAVATISSPAAVAAATQNAFAGAPLAESQVSAPARLVARAPLVYPPAARAEQIETDVHVELVVDAAGHVVGARALTNAGYGLEGAALASVRGYRFSPAMKDGRAVAVRMRWTVQFRLD
jgi:TonB family protein